MCGIGGLVGSFTETSLRDKCQKLHKALRHRGPDDQGTHVDVGEQAHVGLVHARLSILDLSPTGHQPMHSLNGRFTIVFNGEIYNFSELRQKLIEDGAKLRSTGDTEVILELFARKGEACLDDLAGMFAFAIWDRDRRELFLARDGLGIKPLYVWQSNGQIAFASELRALLATGLSSRTLNPQALAGYLLMGSVQEPHTLVEDIEMLPAGSSLTWRDGSSRKNRYWSIDFSASQSTKQVGQETANRSSSPVELVREALKETISRHFVSDVPVGIFLSGGIDSTALVSLAKQQGFKQIKTFSIGFNEAKFNEGDLAKRTADHFGTEHHQWCMTPEDGQKLFDSYLGSMDQPSNDGFNSYCVSKFAHEEGMKVVLSGLGGDELFGSYPSFSRIPKMLDLHRKLRMFGPLRSGVALALRTIRPTAPQVRLAEFVNSAGDTNAAYQATRGSFGLADTAKLVAHFTGISSRSVGEGIVESLPDWNARDQVSYLELTRYMRNQLLRDSDVMSMAWGLELRVPFVDRRLVECLTKIPQSIRLASGKKLLVEAVGDIPNWILEQPKRGFQFPFQEWLAGNAAWSSQFNKTLDRCPVQPKAWYQQWMLVVLEKAIANCN